MGRFFYGGMAMTTETQTDTLIPAPPEREPSSLFHYSAWAHAGAGAHDCAEVDEVAGTCQCADTAHFHAWCRLPNPFQFREIRERALAAKARKLRQLRSPGSDVNDILEGDIELLAGRGEDARTELVEELLTHEWWRDYMVAMRETRDLDDTGDGAEEGEKLYAHIEEDQKRFARLSSQDPSERSADEFEELQTHIQAYNVAVDERFAAMTESKRAALEATDLNDVLDMVRKKRIETESANEFQHHFAIHEWLACAYKSQDDLAEPYFRDLKHLERAAPEVLAVLQQTFDDLERTAREAQGN